MCNSIILKPCTELKYTLLLQTANHHLSLQGVAVFLLVEALASMLVALTDQGGRC